MSRKRARVLNPDGSANLVSRKFAFQLLKLGYERVSSSPLVIQPFQAREYFEEKRHLSGRIVPGATRGKFNGRYGGSKKHRCRPPRIRLSVEEIELRDYKRRYFTRHGKEGEVVVQIVRSSHSNNQ